MYEVIENGCVLYTSKSKKKARDMTLQYRRMGKVDCYTQKTLKYKYIMSRCKDAYRKGDMEKAYHYWCGMYDELERREKRYDYYDDDWIEVHREFNNYMSKFTNQEVYEITDYGKEKYYKEKGYYD